MELKRILKDLILEKSKSITGDDDAYNLAKGDEHLGNVEKRLGKLGIGVASMEKFFTLNQLAVEPFKITIRVKTKSGDDQELDLPEYMNYSFLGIIDTGADNKTNLNVKLKNLKDNSINSMIFNENELFNVIPGTKDKLKSLVVGNEYTVKYDGTFSNGVDPKEGGKDGEDGEGDGKDGGGKSTTYKPPNGLLGSNRGTQLSYLTTLFSKDGKDMFSLLGINGSTKLPETFFDNVLMNNKDKVGKFFDGLLKGGSFTKNIKSSEKDEWVNKVMEDKETLSVINWVRNTRKNIDAFMSNLNKNFPSFDIADRGKGKPKKPGKKGEAMNQSILTRYDLINENKMAFSKHLNQKTLDLNLFTKNLTHFMELLSMMYKVEYNREAVYNECKSNGCKQVSKKEEVEESIQNIVQRIVEEGTQDEPLTISIVNIELDQKAKAKKGKDFSSIGGSGGSGGSGGIDNFNALTVEVEKKGEGITGTLDIKIKSISDEESGVVNSFNGEVFVEVSKVTPKVLIIKSKNNFGDIGTPYLKVQIEDPQKAFTQQNIEIAKGAGDEPIGKLEYKAGKGDFNLTFK